MLNHLLQSDLRLLANEARSKAKGKESAELKDALEKAQLKLRFLAKTKTDESTLIADSPEILKPFLVACRSGHQKIRASGVSGLHNLIAHQAVGQSFVKDIVAELLQLHLMPSDDSVTPIKVLQCVVNLISTDKRFFIHGSDLWCCLQIQFKMHALKDPSLQGIASAGIRQSIGSVFEHVKSAHAKRSAPGAPPEAQKILQDCVKDAELILQDLCSLVVGVDPKCLTLEAAKDSPFLLELIDDILANFKTLFAEIPSITEIVRAQICPLIVFIIKGQKDFLSLMRIMRIIANMGQHFPDVITEEAETIIIRLIVILDNASEYPMWMRCFVLELFRELVQNIGLILALYERYDLSQSISMVARLFRTIGRYIQVNFKKTIVWEAKPFANDNKPRCLEMLSSQSPGEILPSYPITVALSVLIGIVDSIEASTAKCLADPNSQLFKSLQQLSDNLWPSLLVLSFVLTKSRHDGITQTVLKSYQSFTQSCGLLELYTPQDTFLTELHKFAVPTSFRKPLHHTHVVNHVTKKNVFTMKRVLNVAHQMGNSLKESWSIVLEILDVLCTLLSDPATTVINEEGSDTALATTKDEMQVLTSALQSVFSTSQYLDTEGVTTLLKQLEKNARLKLFPTSQADIESINEANETFVSYHLTFGLTQMISVTEANMHRMRLFWPQIGSFLHQACLHGNKYVRYHSVMGYTKIAELALKREQTTSEPDADELQSELLKTMAELARCQYEDVRGIIIDQLHSILEQSAYHLKSGWPFVLQIIKDTITHENYSPNPRHIAKTFSSLQRICTDHLPALSTELLKYLVVTIGSYGRPVGSDVNVALTSVGNLLWNASDFIANELTPKTETSILSEIWLIMFSQLQTVALSSRTEIRTAALRCLFGIINSHGSNITTDVWEQVLQMLYDMLETIGQHAGEASNEEGLAEYQLGLEDGKSIMMLVHHTRNSAAKQWNETSTLSKDLKDTTVHWKKLMTYVDKYWDSENVEISLAAVKAVETMLTASSDAVDYPIELWNQGWKTYGVMVTTLSLKEERVSHSTIHTFTNSIQNLFTKLHPKFRPEDVKAFLKITKPLATLPVEYSGELGPLQKVLCHICEQAAKLWSFSIPQVYFNLLHHISQTIGYPFISKSFPEPVDEKLALKAATWNPTIETIDKNKLSLAERSLNTLVAIWSTDIPNEIRLQVLDDLVFVLGRVIQIRQFLPDVTLWSIAIQLFIKVVHEGIPLLQENPKPTVDTNILWTDLLDSLETYLVRNNHV